MHGVIAAHKQSEQTLRYFAMIAEGAYEGIVVVDADLFVQFVNTRWTRMHGYKTKAELIGKPLRIFHSRKLMSRDVKLFVEEAILRGRHAGPLEHLRKDGTSFDTETRVMAFEDEPGKAAGFIIYAREADASKGLNQVPNWKNVTEVKELTKRFVQPDKQISEYTQVVEQLKQQNAELTAANDHLQQQITELNQSANNWDEYREALEQQNTELADIVSETHEPEPEGDIPEDVLNLEHLADLAGLARRLADRF